MKITIKFMLFLAAVALVLGSCTRNFEEINANPNQPSSVSTAFLLTSAQKQLMDHMSDEWWLGRRGNQLAQFWASNQYSSESRYQLRTNVTNNYWLYFYAGRDGSTGNTNGGGMADLQEIIRLNTESPEEYAGYGDNDNQIAVANIMKAWTFQMLTDCFGAIPFDEALKGSEFPSPAYNTQEEVYMGILAMLSEADAMIKEGSAGPQGDEIFGGDMTAWKKFANSIKLRAAMRIADVSDHAEHNVEEAIASGVFESNSDNAHFYYLSGAPNNHPINEDYKTRNDFCGSNTFIDYLLMMNDPRIDEYFNTPANGGGHVGEVYGLTEEDAALTPNASVSQRSDKVLAATFPGTYMDYAEVEFFLAEACERGWLAESAEDHYNAGIQASMSWWGIDQADIDTYMAQASVAYSTAEGDWNEKIGRQKWIALYMQGIEGWTEYRRLDFGLLQQPAGGALAGDGDVIKRMQYPLDEQTLNAASYQAAIAAQGADALEASLWWDAN